MGTVTTTDVVNGTATDAGIINANFAAVKTEVNGGLDNTNIDPAAAIAVSKLAPGTNTQVLTTSGGVAIWAAPAGGGGGGGIPVGAGMDFWGTSAPSGWLFCDGSAISRTTYADLFAAIGVANGAGDGSSTFNLPDKRGRVSVGKGTHTDVSTLGATDGLGVADRRPKHKHTVLDTGHTHTYTVVSGTVNLGASGGGNPYASAAGTNTGSSTTGITVGPQTNSPTDGPANIVCNYIIYAGV